MLYDRSLTVGITGMPGSGKSFLSRLLREDGHPVFSADQCVAALYEPGGDGAEMIKGRFGGVYTTEAGGVDKPRLFAAMLESDQLRREVMDMIHPMVRHACLQFFKAHADAPVVFAEIPLLVESGWHKGDFVDVAVCVDCDESLRTGEFRNRRGLSPEMLAAFDAWQWPAADKLAACDMAVHNPGTPEGLRHEALALVRRMEEERAERIHRTKEQLQSLWTDLVIRLNEADS
jgi:23S rRNA pseudouridine1911/1915/1917 synthase